METQEVKLPSHLSNIYKKMVAEGLIVDKKYVGEIPLSEYLKSVESSDSTEEKPPIARRKKPKCDGRKRTYNSTITSKRNY